MHWILEDVRERRGVRNKSLISFTRYTMRPMYLYPNSIVAYSSAYHMMDLMVLTSHSLWLSSMDEVFLQFLTYEIPEVRVTFKVETCHAIVHYVKYREV